MDLNAPICERTIFLIYNTCPAKMYDSYNTPLHFSAKELFRTRVIKKTIPKPTF